MLRTSAFCLVALMAGLSVSGDAAACDRPAYRTITVVSYETRQVPVTVWKTVCDHYGNHVRVPVTVYRAQQVAVSRQVRAAY